MEGPNASDRRLEFTKAVLVDELYVRDTVGLRPREQFIEAGKLPFVRRDDNFSTPLVRNCIFVTICVESAVSFNAEPRLEGSRFVVDPSMNYATAVSRLV